MHSVAFSCNGKRIISGYRDGRVQFWDSELSNHIADDSDVFRQGVVDVAISCDGLRVVSVSSDKSMRIWDACTGAQIGNPLGKGCVRCIPFSPGGRRLVFGDGVGALRYRDLESSKVVGDGMRGHTTPASCVAFSLDGHRLSPGR